MKPVCLFALSDKTNIKKAFEEERKQSRWGKGRNNRLVVCASSGYSAHQPSGAESELRRSNAWEQA